MVLAPLVAGLVVRVAQAPCVSGGLLGAVLAAIPPPPGRVTLTTDDEGARTPPASNLSARRVLVHIRTPWWCERREELGCGEACVRDTGRTSASPGGLGVPPGPSAFKTSAATSPTPSSDRGPTSRTTSPGKPCRTSRHDHDVATMPARHPRHPRAPRAAAGVGPWSPAIAAKVGPSETGGDTARGTDNRSRPTVSPGCAATSARAATSCPTDGPAPSTRRLPASVSETLRVVRARSTTRSCSSSCRTAWLTADLETPSSRAALLKLRCRATTRNA